MQGPARNIPGDVRREAGNPGVVPLPAKYLVGSPPDPRLTGNAPAGFLAVITATEQLDCFAFGRKCLDY